MRAFLFLCAIQGYAAFNLTWGVPALNLHTNPPPGDTDGNASVAVDPMGHAVAVWGRTSGHQAIEEILAALYNHSLRTWTGAVRISGGGNASNAKVTIDENGSALLIWEEGFPTQIFSRTLTAQGVWIPDVTMPPTPVRASKNAQVFPQITLDPASGEMIAIWMEFSGGIYRIHSAKKGVDAPWIDLGEVSSGIHSATLPPRTSLAVGRSGKGMAVWEELHQGVCEVHGAAYSQGAWGQPLRIAAVPKKSCEFPSVGVDAAGNGVIVWSEENSIRSKTWIEGKLSDPLLVSSPTQISLHPAVGVDGAGNGVVVFERYNAMHKFISAADLPFKGSSWTSPRDISGPTDFAGDGTGYPVLSINSIGDGVAVWKESTRTHRIIRGSGYSLGTWCLPQTLSSADTHSGASPYDVGVSLNLAGNIIAVWPEDPSRTGSFQIKATAGAGLANLGPPPPLPDPLTIQTDIVFGQQKKIRFPAHTDLINILTWVSSNGAAYYNVYHEDLARRIGRTDKPLYEHHQREPEKQEIYLVTSVDQYGQESGPITIVVPPFKK